MTEGETIRINISHPGALEPEWQGLAVTHNPLACQRRWRSDFNYITVKRQGGKIKRSLTLTRTNVWEVLRGGAWTPWLSVGMPPPDAQEEGQGAA